MRKIVIRTLVLALILGAGWGVYAIYKKLPQKQQEVANTKVRQGDVIIRSFARGELRAVRSMTLSAPNLFSAVQVTRLAPMGSLAHEKDLIVEFDDSERRAQLEESTLEVEQTDEQIKKSEADLAIRRNQDQVDLLKARYGVRRAELEVKRNPLLAEIDAKKNLLNLEEAHRRLQQLENDVKSREEQSLAEIAVLKEQRNKSMVELARERARIAQAKILSPMTGLVAVKQNRSGGFFFPGMQVPDIREGDTLQPGVPVADVLDLSDMEVLARVGELDRANLHEGQEVSIRLDASPDKTFKGRIKSMSATASSNVFSGDPSKKFDVTFSLDMKELLTGLGATSEQIRKILESGARNAKKPPEAMTGGTPAPGAQGAPGTGTGSSSTAKKSAPPATLSTSEELKRLADETAKAYGTDAERENAKLPPPPEEDSQLEVLLRPGLLADVEIVVEKIPNAISIPNQAVFEKDGKQFVYVKEGNRYQPRFITISKRSESVTIVASALKPGETIALADPTVRKESDKPGKKSNGMAGMPGGSQ